MRGYKSCAEAEHGNKSPSNPQRQDRGVGSAVPTMLFMHFLLICVPTHIYAQGDNQTNHLVGRGIFGPSWSTDYFPTDGSDNNFKNKFIRIHYWAKTPSTRILEIAEKLDNGRINESLTKPTNIEIHAGLNEITVPFHSFNRETFLPFGYKISITGGFRDHFTNFVVISVDLIDTSASSSGTPPINTNIYSLSVLQKRQLLKQKLLDADQWALVVPRSRSSTKAMEWLEKNLDITNLTKSMVTWFSVYGVKLQVPRSDFFLWFAQKLADPVLGLFKESQYVRGALFINPDAEPHHYKYFRVVGRMMGLAILNEEMLGVSFAPSIIKLILNQPVEPSDLKYVDVGTYQTLRSLVNKKLPKDPPVWAVQDNDSLIELIPMGHTIAVTEETKLDYAYAHCQWYLADRIRDQMHAIRQGLFDVIPEADLRIFRPEELDLVISGNPVLDILDWQTSTRYVSCQKSDPLIRWFWDCVQGWNSEKRAKLLFYVTNTYRVPIEGFQKFEVPFQTWFRIRVVESQFRVRKGKLNTLRLPKFPSYDALVSGLERAIKERPTLIKKDSFED